MRSRIILILSLGLNLVFLTAWAFFRRPASSVAPGPDDARLVSEVNTQRPRYLLRRQFFTWGEIESPDYPTYIANLRSIDCPESTIRDIVVADVNQLYAHKRASDVVTPEQQWWRSDPDTNVAKLSAEAIRELDQERKALLTKLLGPNWELPDPTQGARSLISFNGPVLGELSAQTKQAVEDIAKRSQARTDEYVEAQRKAGENPDPTVLANFRLQSRNELSKILTPSQLEEFLLRYSQSAVDLRRDFGGFAVTPEEFRKVFRASDGIDQQLQLQYSGDDPNTAREREVIEKRRDEAIKAALGPERYAAFREAILLRNTSYRDAVNAVNEAGVSASAIPSMFAINQAVAQELNRIAQDPNLTDQQKTEQAAQVKAQQAQAQDQLLGRTNSAQPPIPPTPTTPVFPTQVHAYSPGETIDQIAARYGVTPGAIQAANPNVDFNQLGRGTSIHVPQQSPPK